MFPWSRKKLTKTDFFKGYTDCHCHILPAVDDGIPKMEDALDVLHCYEELGIAHVVLTPHIMSGQHSDIATTETRFEELQAAYQGPITLKLAAEYMLDEGFKAQMERGLKCVLNDIVLVETSYFAPPLNMDERLNEIYLSGFSPLIAHPERYSYMDKKDYKRLKDRGYLFQLDLLSLSQVYGADAYEKSLYLLQEGMYNMVGTDLHSLKRFLRAIDKIKLKSKQLKALMNLTQAEY